MKHRNQAILAKLCWRLANEQESPWARMLATKYLSPRRIAEEGTQLPCSSIWVACKKGGPIYVKDLKWSVKNGESIKVWQDFWLPMTSYETLTQEEDC